MDTQKGQSISSRQFILKMNRSTVLLLFLCLFPCLLLSQTAENKNVLPDFEASFTDSLWQVAETVDSVSDRAELMLDEYYAVFNKNHADGIIWVGEALKLARNDENQQLTGRAYLCLGTIWYMNGDYKQAFAYYQRALQIFQSLNDLKYLGRTYNELSVYYRKQKQYDKALECLDFAYESCLEADDMICVETSFNTRGVICELMGNLSEAKFFYKKAEKVAKENGNRIGLSYIYNNLADVYGGQNKFDSAEIYIGRSIEIRKQLEDVQGMAMNYVSQGHLFMKMQQFEKAILSLNKGIELAKEVKYADLIKQGHRSLSQAYKGLNQLEKSLFHLEQSYQLNDSLLSTKKIQALSDMEVKYETEKKEKVIAQKQADLVKQEIKLQERNLWLFIAIAIGCIVLLTAGFLVWTYRLKGKQLKQEARMDMQNERLRISRDLHDNIGAELTLISSSLYSTDQKSTGEKEYLQRIGSYAKNAMNQLRETVWVIQKENVTLYEFHAKVSEYAYKICSASGIQFQPHVVPKDQLKLSSTQTINLFRACQEAINNAVKYSNCNSISLQMRYNKSTISIVIADDGKGFDVESCSKGNGIENMRERIRELNGSFSIKSKEGKRTTVQFENIPVQSL